MPFRPCVSVDPVAHWYGAELRVLTPSQRSGFDSRLGQNIFNIFNQNSKKGHYTRLGEYDRVIISQCLGEGELLVGGAKSVANIMVII